MLVIQALPNYGINQSVNLKLQFKSFKIMIINLTC